MPLCCCSVHHHQRRQRHRLVHFTTALLLWLGFGFVFSTGGLRLVGPLRPKACLLLVRQVLEARARVCVLLLRVRAAAAFVFVDFWAGVPGRVSAGRRGRR